MQESTAPKLKGGARPGAGRPRREPTLAGAARAKFPVEKLIAMAEKLASSDDEDTQRWALQWIAERAHGKVTDKHEVGPPGSMDDADEDALADQLTDAEMDELDRLDDLKAKILDRARDRPAIALLPAADRRLVKP